MLLFFDYVDKILIALSTSGGVSIISFTSVAGARVGIASASFTLIFFLTFSNIWFKNHNFAIEADEGNHKNYDSDDEKKRRHV